MADPPAQGSSSFGFLTRKVGPLPVWAWGAIAFGAYYWWTHYGPGAKPAAAPAPARTGGPTVVEVDAQRGPRGARGPRGFEDRDRRDRDRRPRDRDRPIYPARGPAPAAAPPVRAAAPTTGADVYGDVPVATANGSTYDSGDVAGTMGDPYALGA